MHRPDSDYDKPLGGCMMWVASAVIVLMALWMIYDVVAERLHW